MRRLSTLVFLTFLLSPSWTLAQDGLPVENELIRTACGSCHASDADGRMSRISYQRKSPEGWQITLKRMIRTNGLDLTPAQAREIVRYLSDHHGLAPEEARPFFYRAEKRPRIEKFEDEELSATCVRCHLGARFATQRRTTEEWNLLKGMHIGYFPVIESQTFRGPSPMNDGGVFGPDSNVGDGSKWRADRVLAKLAEAYPFDTPAYRSFRAKQSTRQIAGSWILKSHIPAQGPVSGVVTFEGADGDYTYSAELTRADGTAITRTGEGVLYGGYSWRGRSSAPNAGPASELREVMMLSKDSSKLTGRWFYGTYGELGADVSLTRLGNDPVIASVWPPAAKVGAGAVTVTVRGANLADGDLEFGQGVRVTSIDARSATSMTVTLDVSDDALSGYRDVAYQATRAMNAFAVYDSVDYVKVVPEEGLSRVGGGSVPKQLAQFEAVAYHRGHDDEILTDDDINLGVVRPEWSIEEYHIRHEDDDADFVGTIDADGLFTPSIDGPNMDRELNANNMGDIWIVASYTPDGASDTIRGRSRLVVAPPLFVYWELMP